MSLRLQAPDDVFKYGEYVFGYHPSEHHREMVGAIQHAIETRRNTVILEPRGAAKSTWGNTISLSHYIAKNKDARVGLFSKTAVHAFDFSRAIRWTLEKNEKFREVFGHLVSDSKWTDSEWLRADSKWHGSNNVTLFAQGVFGQIVSKRFDVILCDDILDEENTANVDQMERLVTWFTKTLLPCLAPDGVIILLGTRWAEGDLYERLIKPKADGGKGWDHIVRSALTPDGDGWKSFWPEYFTVDKLLELRDEMGPALFSCAMQNDISGLMEGNIFSRRDFEYFGTLPEDQIFTVRMGVDLASSVKERADFTARVVTAEDEKHNFYVLSVVRDKIASGHTDFIADGWRAYPNLNLVIIENQQFQSTLIQQLMDAYPGMPIEGKRADTDKVTRARAVAAKYEARRVFHHRSLEGSDFETELLSFPKGHDDMVDALGYSMDMGGGRFVFGSLPGR